MGISFYMIAQYKLYSEQMNSQQNLVPESLRREGKSETSPLPFYSLTHKTTCFQAKLPSAGGNYFAQGCLLGHFYSIKERVTLDNVQFVGNFEGVIDKGQEEIFFEGTIDKIYLILPSKQGETQIDPLVFRELYKFQTFFKGYFKGKFYQWPSSASALTYELQPTLVEQLNQGDSCQKAVVLGEEVGEETGEIFLPTLVRFEVEDIREVNLEKSFSVISGHFYIQIHYNDIVKRLVDNTRQVLRQMKSARQKCYQQLLRIELSFQRDFNIALSLEDDQDGEEFQSEGSEWSIIDKTWDTTFEDDEIQHIYKFSVWKRFTTEIDNSYGSLFAPFNLTTLRIVMDMNSFLVRNRPDILPSLPSDTLKVNLVGMNFQKEDLCPFSPLSELSQQGQLSRYHKINRSKCKDRGVYLVADNRLSLFPFYRNVLINKNTANEDWNWVLGVRDRSTLLKDPPVKKIEDSFNEYLGNSNIQKVETFSFQKWSYIIVEVPVYKYVVIDMLLVFVPIFLLSVISLLIYSQTNGVSNISGYTTLAYRLVNISSMLIAYVSLIPVIRQNLPPMPGVTLVEVITYLCVVPNFLSLLSSMLSYTTSLLEWEQSYRVFSDWVYLLAFVMTILNFVMLLLIILGYYMNAYSWKKSQKWGTKKVRDDVISSRAYSKFMEKTMKCRRQYQIEQFPDLIPCI